MKKKLVIHFGIHRTGTTFLQNNLKRNRSRLIEHGILYPDLGFGCNHSRVAWGLIRNKVGDYEINSKWLIEKINAEIDPKTTLIILSHEDFCLIESNEWLVELKKEYEVEVVIYLRRQDVWLESWYNQHVKWPWNKKFSSSTPKFFLEHYKDFFWIDYFNLLENLLATIERENLYVNVVDRLGAVDTTIDFFEHIGVGAIIDIESDSNANSSLSAAKIDILRRVDLMSLRKNGKAKQKILKCLRELNIDEDDGNRYFFSDEEVKSISDVFSDSNRKVAQKYFNRDTLFGDSLKLNRQLVQIPDWKAYRIYIPRLLKKVALE